MATAPQYFVSHLLRANRKLTVADIEVEASVAGVHDDIWPMDSYKQHLRVTPEEIDAVRSRKQRVHNAWKHTKRVEQHASLLADAGA